VAPLVALVGDFRAVVPPGFDEPGAPYQRVLEGAVQGEEPRVVPSENVVDVVGGLFGQGLVLGAFRDELHGLLGAEEDTHQGRQNSVDRIANVLGDDLTAALLLVPERLARVVPRRFGAVGADFLVNVVRRLLQGSSDDGLDILVPTLALAPAPGSLARHVSTPHLVAPRRLTR